jgi:hypothetical protein
MGIVYQPPKPVIEPDHKCNTPAIEGSFRATFYNDNVSTVPRIEGTIWQCDQCKKYHRLVLEYTIWKWKKLNFFQAWFHLTFKTKNNQTTQPDDPPETYDVMT